MCLENEFILKYVRLSLQQEGKANKTFVYRKKEEKRHLFSVGMNVKVHLACWFFLTILWETSVWNFPPFAFRVSSIINILFQITWKSIMTRQPKEKNQVSLRERVKESVWIVNMKIWIWLCNATHPTYYNHDRIVMMIWWFGAYGVW